MKHEKQTGKTLKNLVNILDGVLCIEANTASCLIFYQPKTPEKLSRFRKSK